jgi:mannose-6-phosphate isomerase-like protein (cupin superfamily)
MEAINLADKLAAFDETWVPKIIGALNGQLVKLVKFEGEYVWHAHEREDELFLVLEGSIDIHFRDRGASGRSPRERVVTLAEGEMCIVPRGVEHKPVAPDRASIMLFEPASTRNTGDVDHAYTLEPEDLERI